MRRLEALPEERAYQILDYIEFLESKYAERSAPSGILAKITDTVEDTMRAAKLPVQAVTGAASVMDSASRLMRGLAAAGSAVVNEAVKAASSDPAPTATPKSPEPNPAVPPNSSPRTDA